MSKWLIRYFSSDVLTDVKNRCVCIQSKKYEVPLASQRLALCKQEEFTSKSRRIFTSLQRLRSVTSSYVEIAHFLFSKYQSSRWALMERKRRKSFQNKTNTQSRFFRNVCVKIRNLIHVELFHVRLYCDWDWWRCSTGKHSRTSTESIHTHKSSLSLYSIRGISSSFPRLAHFRCSSNLNHFHASSICKFDKLRHKFTN